MNVQLRQRQKQSENNSCRLRKFLDVSNTRRQGIESHFNIEIFDTTGFSRRKKLLPVDDTLTDGHFFFFSSPVG